jgi:hypothetical protein
MMAAGSGLDADTVDGIQGATLRDGSYGQDYYVNALYHDEWVRNHTNNNGHYWSQTQWHMYPKDADDFYVRAGTGSSVALVMTVGNEVARGHVYANTSNEIGFLNSSRNWSLKVDNSGNVTPTGTVDGRDVAADGTKLDGISAGANVGIPLSGGTFTGNVSFGSNNITQVDNISVMNRIYHYADTNTYIQFYNDEIQIWPGGKQIALFTANANWYDGSVRFQNVGDVNVGVSGQSCELRVTGNVIAYYSDERLKTKTGNIENALDKVNSLEGFYYVENDLAKSLGYNNSLTQVALSAQQVQEVMPECVSLAPFDIADQRDVESRYAEGRTSRSGEDYLTVDYGKLVPLLVESIKELTARVEELENATT